jgi:hypothetical protein
MTAKTKAPMPKAPVADHKKHAAEFLEIERHKQPKPTSNEEARP